MRRPQPPSSKPPRILIVDDIPQNVDLVSSLMRAEGYEVASASNGLEALAQVASAPPDLILLDIMMPTADIFDALTTARPYKPARSQAAAIAALRDEVARGWRDPGVVEPFIELVERGGLPEASQAQ